MSCDGFHELISADLDGEADEVERAALASHLESCAACAAFAAQARTIHRSSRVAPAAHIPDLTDAILDRAGADPSVEVVGRRPGAARSGRRARRPAPARLAVVAFQYGLLVVALSMAVLAVPELLASSGDAVHTSRHLGGWDVAFAIGLVLAALQPWRARGLLPMAAALAGVMVVTAAVDVGRGSTAGLAEGTHLLEVAGLVFLWLLARSALRGDQARGDRPRPADDPLATTGARLRALPSRFGLTPPLAGSPATARLAPTDPAPAGPAVDRRPARAA